MTRTITVPANHTVLGFDWKLEAALHNSVTFNLDGGDAEAELQDTIVNWHPRLFDITAGTHTITFCFNQGEDHTWRRNKAWVDNIHVREPVQTLGPEKAIFVTDNTYNGSLGGTVGADAICQAHAEKGIAVGTLPDGTYKALLSTSQTPARTRLTSCHLINSRGETVATTCKELWHNGTEEDSLGVRYNATGGYPDSSWSWTGSTYYGATAADTCNGWSSPFYEETGLIYPGSFIDGLQEEEGNVGLNPDSGSQDWIYAFVEKDCTSQATLYCVQQ